MTFEELEKTLGKKLNRDEWDQIFHITYNIFCENKFTSTWYQKTAKFNSKYSICENAIIYQNSSMDEYCRILDNSQLYENAKLCYYVNLKDNVKVHGNCVITGPLTISGNIEIYGNVIINPTILESCGYIFNKDIHHLSGDFEIYDYKSLESAIKVSNMRIEISRI